jgi:hypothetical protein
MVCYQDAAMESRISDSCDAVNHVDQIIGLLLMNAKIPSILGKISTISWGIVIVSFLVYNFFWSYFGLSEGGCNVGQKSIVFRAVKFCVSDAQFIAWNYNILIGEMSLGLALSTRLVSEILKRRIKL